MKNFFALISVRIEESNMRRQFLFKQLRVEQGVDKLPAIHGAWIEHMRRAHVQANIWHRDMVLKLTCLHPLTMGVEILRPKASTGSFTLGCTSSGLSAAARPV